MFCLFVTLFVFMFVNPKTRGISQMPLNLINKIQCVDNYTFLESHFRAVNPYLLIKDGVETAACLS